MSVSAQVVHQIPGRLRLRIESVRGQDATFKAIEDTLRRCPEVEATRANPLTGSVLVAHTGPSDGIIEYARSQHLFDVREQEPPRDFVTLVDAHMDAADEWVRRHSNGEANLGNITATGLLVATLFQLTRGHILSEGVTLVRYALEALEFSRRSRTRERA